MTRTWLVLSVALAVGGACSRDRARRTAAVDAAAARTDGPGTASGPVIDPDAPADRAAPPADAEKLPSGLASKVLRPGTGTKRPASADIVRIHYTGWTAAGVKFDSSLERRRPMTFALGQQTMADWIEGLRVMTAGEKRRFWVPAAIAYGGREPPPQAPRGDLVFDVELLSFQTPPKAPPDVARVPASARRTASGLAYRVLRRGTGKAHPTAESMVRVVYAGWTTDGKMFDSSLGRGDSATLPLQVVIPGWREGLQLMTVGEKTRFWIPAALAYGEKPERPGAPAGMLVFDVELLEIK